MWKAACAKAWLRVSRLYDALFAFRSGGLKAVRRLREIVTFQRLPKAATKRKSLQPHVEGLESRQMPSSSTLPPIAVYSPPALAPVTSTVFTTGTTPPSGSLTASQFTPGSFQLQSESVVSAVTTFTAPETDSHYSNTTHVVTEDTDYTLTISGDVITGGWTYEEDYTFTYDIIVTGADSSEVSSESWGTATYVFVATTTSTESYFTLTIDMNNHQTGSQTVSSAPLSGGTGAINWSWHNDDQYHRTVTNHTDLVTEVITGTDAGSGSASNSASGTGTYDRSGVDGTTGIDEAVSGTQGRNHHDWTTLDYSWTIGASSSSGWLTSTLGSSFADWYSGSGTYSATSTSGMVNESGSTTFYQQSTSHEDIDSSGQWELTGGSGSGNSSGWTTWSYSGSGNYATSLSTNGIGTFSSPFAAVSTSSSGTVTGTAHANASKSTSYSDNWAASEDASGVWSYSGSGIGSASGDQNSWYSGSGSFSETILGSASGAQVTLSGTATESGEDHNTGGYHSNYSLAAGGSWALQGGSGSGSESGSTSWSYVGSGSFSHPQTSGGIGLFSTPFAAVNTTSSGTVTGTTLGSGHVQTTYSNLSWTASEDASGAWSYSGSASVTKAGGNDSSYAGSGSFTQTMVGSASGASATVNGTVTESGEDHATGTYHCNYTIDAAGNWELLGGTGSGSQSGNSEWSYSGSGSYSYPDPETSESITGSVNGSGSTPSSYSYPWTATNSGSNDWTYQLGVCTQSGTPPPFRAKPPFGQATANAGTSYVYQGSNLIEVVDPNQNVTTFTYNGQGKVTCKTDALGNVTTYTYNDQGLLASKTNPDGSRIEYGYDESGHETGETWYAPDNTVTETITFTYNSQGQMLTASNSVGTYTFSYNSQGQLSGVTEPFGVSLTFGYDSAGHRTSVQDSFGGESDSEYNAQGQLISEVYKQDGQVVLRIDQTYNSAGQVTQQTRYSDDGVTVVATTDYTYNSAGQVTEILSKTAGGTTIDDWAYTYDASGQLLSETDNGTTVANYTYDQTGSPAPNGMGVIGQLIGDGTRTYAYDPAGNRTGSGYVIGTGNQLLSDGAYNYTYDAQGNETTKTNIATGDQWTYGYNVANQLVSAVEKTASGNVEVSVEYKYDAFGNRVEKDVTDAESNTTVTKFALDGWNPAKSNPIGNENWDVWADLDVNGSLTTRYMRGDVIDQIFAEVGANGSLWTLTDRLGSVRDILDQNGQVKDAIRYDGFGNILSESHPDFGGRFKYTGREFDVETQLQYNRERWYDATTGRWVTQDPLGFGAGDSNLYRYVHNQAAFARDPSGLSDEPLITPATLQRAKAQKTVEPLAILQPNALSALTTSWNLFGFTRHTPADTEAGYRESWFNRTQFYSKALMRAAEAAGAKASTLGGLLREKKLPEGLLVLQPNLLSSVSAAWNFYGPTQREWLEKNHSKSVKYLQDRGAQQIADAEKTVQESQRRAKEAKAAEDAIIAAANLKEWQQREADMKAFWASFRAKQAEWYKASAKARGYNREVIEDTTLALKLWSKGKGDDIELLRDGRGVLTIPLEGTNKKAAIYMQKKENPNPRFIFVPFENDGMMKGDPMMRPENLQKLLRPPTGMWLDTGEPEHLWVPQDVKFWGNSKQIDSKYVAKFNTDNYDANHTVHHWLLTARIPVWRSFVMFDEGKGVAGLYFFIEDGMDFAALKGVAKGGMSLLQRSWTGNGARLAATEGVFQEGTFVRNGERLVIAQGPHPNCGVASAAMVAETEGRFVLSENFVHIARRNGWLTESGILRSDIVSLLDQAARVNAVELTGQTIAQLRAATSGGTPAIVELVAGGQRHAVVVDGVTRRMGQTVVAIRNPHGQQYFQLVSEFETLWQAGGRAMVVPRPLPIVP